MTDTTTYNFTNERDAVLFARSHGGPIVIDIEHVARGQWVVTISPR